jgi:hypothetical protein
VPVAVTLRIAELPLMIVAADGCCVIDGGTHAGPLP